MTAGYNWGKQRVNQWIAIYIKQKCMVLVAMLFVLNLTVTEKAVSIIVGPAELSIASVD